MLVRNLLKWVAPMWNWKSAAVAKRDDGLGLDESLLPDLDQVPCQFRDRLIDEGETLDGTHKREERLILKPSTRVARPGAMDSTGKCVNTDEYRVWYATHAGPDYALKDENQDAAFSTSNDGKVTAFAVADGVSTSYGAAFAAKMAVSMFCEHVLQNENIAHSSDWETALRIALTQTQSMFDQRLEDLLREKEGEEWVEVRGASRITNSVAQRLFENTRFPEKPYWGPVLATTLLGGVVLKGTHESDLEVHLLRLGDGVVEVASTGSNVEKILSMDAEETQIATALSPGPVSKGNLDQAEYRNINLMPGQWLTIASDGLTRGHKKTVFEMLCAQLMAEGDIASIRLDNPVLALDLLVKAARYADKHMLDDSSMELFNDNLSLILVAHNKPRLESCFEQS